MRILALHSRQLLCHVNETQTNRLLHLITVLLAPCGSVSSLSSLLSAQTSVLGGAQCSVSSARCCSVLAQRCSVGVQD